MLPTFKTKKKKGKKEEKEWKYVILEHIQHLENCLCHLLEFKTIDTQIHTE